MLSIESIIQRVCIKCSGRFAFTESNKICKNCKSSTQLALSPQSFLTTLETIIPGDVGEINLDSDNRISYYFSECPGLWDCMVQDLEKKLRGEFKHMLEDLLSGAENLQNRLPSLRGSPLYRNLIAIMQGKYEKITKTDEEEGVYPNPFYGMAIDYTTHYNRYQALRHTKKPSKPELREAREKAEYAHRWLRQYHSLLGSIEPLLSDLQAVVETTDNETAHLPGLKERMQLEFDQFLLVYRDIYSEITNYQEI